jgi:membrane protease YdiL (CAAX protease family)
LPSRFLLSRGVEGEAGDFLSVVLGTGVPVFVAGLFFALHWDRYRNLPLLMALHWGIDTLPSLSSYFKVVEILQYR